MLNRDPGKAPKISEATKRIATTQNMQIVHILCTDKDNPEEVLTFHAVMPFLPRVGEGIYLEGNKACRVHDVVHKVASVTDDDGKLEYVLLLPNVFVELTKREGY